MANQEVEKLVGELPHKFTNGRVVRWDMQLANLSDAFWHMKDCPRCELEAVLAASTVAGGTNLMKHVDCFNKVIQSRELRVQVINCLAHALAAEPLPQPAQPTAEEVEVPSLREREENLLDWLNEKVSEARGSYEFSITEEGNVGLFIGGKSTALGIGQTASEALENAQQRKLTHDG